MRKFLNYYKEIVTEFICNDRAIYLFTTLTGIFVVLGIFITIFNGFIIALGVILSTLITISGLILIVIPISMFIADSIIQYRDNKIKEKESEVFNIEELLWKYIF